MTVQNGIELEAFLTNFFEVYSAAETRFQQVTAREQEMENATQDILHTCELDPESLADIDVVSILTNIRAERRDAKAELEVAKIFWGWVNANKKVLDLLTQKLGEIRKVLERQRTDAYCQKTDILNRRGAWIYQKIIEQPTMWDCLGLDETGKEIKKDVRKR